jgi:polysaccharide export outer membrane protein
MKPTCLATAGFTAAICCWVLFCPQPARGQFHPQDTVARIGVILGADDSITVLALNCEEISKEWRIGSTGDVTFPLIGRLHLEGLTIEQSEQEIATKLKRYLHDPQVTVYPSEIRSRPVTVAGAVERPGKYQISTTSTLLDVLVQAGGPKGAGPTLTLRRAVAEGNIDGAEVKVDKEGAYMTAEFELKEVTDGPAGPGLLANTRVKPFDVITVAPTAAPRYVHIVGEVNHPGSVELVSQNTVSLMKVVAVAGGLSRVAAAGSTLILHINREGIQTSTAIVDLKKIMTGKSKDLDLIDGDIILVPSSKAKVIAGMLSGSALNSGISTAIFTLAKF